MSLEATMQRVLEQCQQTAVAVKLLELRAMKKELSGAEASRLVALALQEYQPHGAVDTWRSYHSRRVLLELMASWSRANGSLATAEVWSLVVEAGYRRALEEEALQDSEAEEKPSGDENITVKEKIAFWRAKIPEAKGCPGVNLLEAQRDLQEEAPGGGLLLQGDLVGWRPKWTIY